MTNKNIPADNVERSSLEQTQSPPAVPQNGDELLFKTNTERISRLLLWMLAFIVPALGIAYLITGNIYFAIIVAYTMVSLVSFFFAHRLAKRGRYHLAAYLILFVILFVSLSVNLIVAGLELALVIETLIFTNVLASLILPRRFRKQAAAASAVVSIAMIVAAVFGTPWQRFAFESTAVVSVITYGVIGISILFVIRELFIAYRRIVRLGVRLSVTFVAIIFVALALTVLTSLVVITGATRVRTFDELETTSQLKQNAIQVWIGTLHSELGNILNESYEQTRARSVLLEEGGEDLRRTALTELEVLLTNVVERNFNFTEIYMINPDGQVIVSSQRNNEDKWVDHEPYFFFGNTGEYVDQPRYSVSDNGLVMVFSQPIYDSLGFNIGIIAGKANLAKLNSLVSATASGISGKTYLVAGNHEIVGEQRYVYGEGIDAALRGQTASAVYDDYDGVTVMGHYQRLPEFDTVMINEIDREEVLATGRRGIILANTVVTIVIEILGIGASILIARSISQPLSRLSVTAGRIAAGEITLRAEVETGDEIGDLARAFNIMTNELQNFIASLEARVQERTDNLAAVGEVTRATASELDIDELLPSVVNSVLERFNLYYVGLFLVDEQQDGSRVARLRAATGDAGRQMMDEGWQLEVGTGSMIGDAISTGQPRVRQSSTESGPWQRNPYLPLTESEMALPLRFGGQVLGAMTVQSVNVDAFDDALIDVGLNLADQMAVAIENARLYTESRQALQRAAIIQQRYQSRAWRDYLTAQDIRGISYSGTSGMETLRAGQTQVQALPDGVTVEDGTLLIPIMQAGQQVGVMGFEGKDGGWNAQEIEILQELALQLSQVAENQRLLDETQQRAAREQTVAQVADSLRQSLDMEQVLSTAAGEIREALGLDRIVVRLAEPEQQQ